MEYEEMEEPEAIGRLNQDLLNAISTIGVNEARYLVDSYYAIQDYRKASMNQRRALTKSEEPHQAISWVGSQMTTLENQIKRALAAWADQQVPAQWAQSIVGIGPVISAGLLAHIDISKAPTAGHIWRFAGLDPTVKWLGKAGAAKLMASLGEMDLEGDEYAMTETEVTEYEAILASETKVQLTTEQMIAISRLTGRKFGNLLRIARTDKGAITSTSMTAALAKRPWNADLKVLCWKIGESFVKVSNHPQDYYGKVYVERKMAETDRNDQLLFRDQADRILTERRIGKDTDAYKAYSVGKLPPAHIHARAKRYAVKLFLSHYHHVLHEVTYGQAPPKPYIIEHGGHTHFLAPPNWLNGEVVTQA